MISRSVVNSGHFPVSALGDVADFLDSQRRPVTEGDRTAGPYPYFGANGQQGTINDYIFDEPLILLAEDGGFFDDPDRGIAYRIAGKTWVNNHAHVLRPRNGVDMGYLCRVLENYDVSPFVTGTTRGKLTKGSAEQIPIPLPPLAEQRRIAAILDQADALRTKRRQALTELNTLTQSIFLEMFGDPGTNSHGLHVEPLGDHLSFVTSGGRGWAQYYAPSGSRFIRSLDVQMNYIGNDEPAFVTAPDNAEARRTRVNTGDVLLTITGSLIGRVAPVPAELAGSFVSQHVAILRLDVRRMTPVFLSFFLSLESGGQRQIAKLQYGQTKPGLNFDQIRRLEIPVPPIGVQREFAHRIACKDAVTEIQVASLRAVSDLFASVQQRAFRGEL